MKKILFLIITTCSLSTGYVMAESYPVAELTKNVDITTIELPEPSKDVDFDPYQVLVYSTVEFPSTSEIVQAQLSGSVENGDISDDGKYITYNNGETASIYTLTIEPGDYTIDGFCIQCTYKSQSFFRDFRLPQITGGTSEIYIITNRPEATLTLATLKSNGKDAFSASGIPYSFEIVEGESSDWIVSDDGHTIEQYIGEHVDTLVIPNMIDGKRIFTVQNDTLLDQNTIGTLFGEYNSVAGVTELAKNIEISEGIQILGSFLFYQCSELEGNIDLPCTIRAVGPYAFAGCSSLTGDLDLSNCVSLYSYSFAGCSGLNGTLTLPAVTNIPTGTFIDCPFSGTLEIPESVTNIGNYAFAMNAPTSSGVSSITLPQALKTIGPVAFQYRNTLKNDLVLPESLEHIGDFAFNHCTGFSNTELYIPSSVETIGGDLHISQGLTSENTGYGGHVFYDAFYNNLGFSSANTGDFITIDGVLLSADGTRLVAYPMAKTDESYVIPEGITQLDEMSFGRTKVKSITLPDSFVFSTTVPENIINTNGNNFAVALYTYNNCAEVLTKNTNPNYTSIDGIIYSKDKTVLWYVPNMHGAVTIEDGCTTIKDGAFFCSGSSIYTKWGTVYIPASVNEIETNALHFLNSCGATITIDENNDVYTVSNNKIIKK